MKSLARIFRFLSSHPLTKDDKAEAFLRFLKWQFFSRFYPYPIIHPFIEGSKLIVEKGMTGATGNIYVGLHEFEDMGFLLHLLRKDDLFGDIGANIGSYTILASGVVNAKSIGVEPIPSTFNHFQDNIKINHIGNLVSAYNNGVGKMEGRLTFTKYFDTVNHVVAEGSVPLGDTVQVTIVTLNNLFSNNVPLLLKIDVEGFELNVLKGGGNVLGSNELKAIIIELNSSGKRYGTSDEEVNNFLLSFNFLPYKYDPFTRCLEAVTTYSESGVGNTIYIRDKEFIELRVSNAREFCVAGKKF